MNRRKVEKGKVNSMCVQALTQTRIQRQEREAEKNGEPGNM